MGGDVVCQGTYRIEYFLAFGRILYLDSIIPFQNQDNLLMHVNRVKAQTVISE